jgi:hypothetical protein
MSHKLTVSELASPKDPDENSTLRRLCILFSLKEACMRGIRQPIDFDVVNSKAQVDSLPLVGWGFWVFKANLGVARGSEVAHDQYKCVCAFYRGLKPHSASHEPTQHDDSRAYNTTIKLSRNASTLGMP